VFFFTYHDFSHAKVGIGNYDLSATDLLGNLAATSVARKIVLSLLGIVSFFSLIRRRSCPRLYIRGPLGRALLGFFVLAFLSPLWAVDPPLTLKKLVELGILCVAALAVVRRLTLRQIILWTFFTTAIFLAIGVIAELAFGTFKPFASGYRFSGTLHPNGTGVECGVLLLSAVASADLVPRWNASIRICAFLALVFLILSGSRTSLVAALLALGVYLAMVSSRPTKRSAALTLSAAACLCLFCGIVGFSFDFSSVLFRGRTDPLSVASLSDRTKLWQDLGDYTRQRPILGYGYCGFWSPTNITLVSDREGWGVPNSHSTYIEYFLTLGATGLLLYTFVLFAGIWRSFRLYRLSRDRVFAFCLALLLFCVVDGFLESLVVEGSILEFLWLVVLMRLASVPFDVISLGRAEIPMASCDVLPAHSLFPLG
jgi:O-antigen ligase